MEEPKLICSFSKLRNFIESSGVTVGNRPTYRAVRAGDITIKNGNLSGEVFEDADGMFAVSDSDGVDRKVFLIKKSYNFGYGSTPKAHLCMCEAVNTFGSSSYRYANDLPISVRDSSSGNNISLSNLGLCNYCRNQLQNEFSKIRSINEFVDILKSADDGLFNEPENNEVDFNGYVKDWNKISEAYRVTKQYKCEKCGIDLDDFQGHFYCQVHHKNGDKLNNRTNNLICLCVACHSNVDARHKDNFSTKANQELLKAFEKYKKENNKQVDVPQQNNPLSVESHLTSLFKFKS